MRPFEIVNECCGLLKRYKVATVRGNHDNWFLSDQMRDLPDATRLSNVSVEAFDWLKSLPTMQEFETSLGRLLLCHGIGAQDMGRVTPDDYGYALDMNYELRSIVATKNYCFMVNGHTHRRMVRTFNHLTVINPGSLVSHHEPGFVSVDFDLGLVKFFSIRDAGIELADEIIVSTVKSEKMNPPPF